MKKILAIASSPEKGGNSDTLLEKYIEGIHSVCKNAIIEKVYLYDIPLPYYSHSNKYPNKEQEPEFVALTEKCKDADFIIIASPVFNLSVPGIFKNFFDRIGYVALDYKNLDFFKQPKKLFTTKKVFVLFTGGGPSWFVYIFSFMYPFFWIKRAFAYYGAKVVSVFYFGGLTYSSPAKSRPNMLERAFKLGKKFANNYLK